MQRQQFKRVACNEKNERWNEFIKREGDLYIRKGDVRSPFDRDYTRLLHSLAYRRLKHKTQVFFNIDNDHICTRMEHVAHVDSVSSTIAKQLGLNSELTRAIAIGHDLGHAPFGHQGETVINRLMVSEGIGESFWHERNGLRFVDKIELLPDNYDIYHNLNLTYAVRDGIISHCGEVNENGLKPRDDYFDLDEFTHSGEFAPATWEACVVKISDKIAYVGRDIEDAICLGFLDDTVLNDLYWIAREHDQNAVNTTVIMNSLITDICRNSSLETGICLSDKYCKQLNEIKQFNEKYIYTNPRLKPFIRYSEMILTSIYEILSDAYDSNHTWERIAKLRLYSKTLSESFSKWLARYCDVYIVPQGDLRTLALKCKNYKIYGDLSNEKLYKQAIIDYLSGMTDRYAIQIFNEFLSY